MHDLNHLLADLLDVGGLSIARGLDLVLLAGGERNAEHADGVAIRGLNKKKSKMKRENNKILLKFNVF